jgi:hypothetical protein
VFVATTPDDTPERRQAAARAFKLLKKFGKRWGGPAARHCHDWQFRAGFPDMLGMTANKLKRNASKIFAHTPVRSLLVTELMATPETLRFLPYDNGVTRLSLWGARLPPDHLPRIAALPTLPRLHTLSLLFNRLDDAAVPILAGDDFFQRLRRIELGANPFTPAAREELRAAFGGRLTFECEREDDHLFAIQSDNLVTGIGRDGTQYVTCGSQDGYQIARFDLAGNVLGVESRPYPSEGERGLFEQLGVRDATVYVKRFTFPDGDRLRTLPGLANLFSEPDTDDDPVFHPTDSRRRLARRRVLLRRLDLRPHRRDHRHLIPRNPMLSRLISSSVANRVVVLALAVLLVAHGTRATRDAPLDVFPEFAPPKVEVQTEAPGLSTDEVEALISVPLESALNGTPGLKTIRSKSVLGLSSVVLLFEEGTDMREARQYAQERVAAEAVRLPAVARPPVILQPLSSLSRVLKIGCRPRRSRNRT